MQNKQNCWEYKECGREPGGFEIEKYGICSASTSVEVDGLNDGKNGGRICWAVAGTFMDGEIAGKFAADKFSCVNCDFFKFVSDEQGADRFEMVTPVQMDHFKKKTSQSCSRIIEKRSSERFYSDLNVNFKCCDRDYTGKVVDISETGMFITSRDMSFPNDANFNVELDINNEHLSLPVRMCRLTISPRMEDGMGVEILNPPQNYLVLIDRLRTDNQS